MTTGTLKKVLLSQSLNTLRNHTQSKILAQSNNGFCNSRVDSEIEVVCSLYAPRTSRKQGMLQFGAAAMLCPLRSSVATTKGG